MDLTMFSNSSGSFDMRRISCSSSSVICISSYSCCSNSTDMTSRYVSNTVDLSLSVFSTDLRIPFRVILFPAVTSPAMSSSTYPVILSGWAPPLRPSGDSCISIFCVSMYTDAFSSRMKRVACLLQLPSVLTHIMGSLRSIPGCWIHISAPHLAHLNRPTVILGLTVVTFLASPSTATSLLRWSALRLRMSTVASRGRLNILMLMASPGLLMLGTRDMAVFLANSRHLSGLSRTYIAKSTL